jgi:hypothetical protein
LADHPATGTGGLSIGNIGPSQLAALPTDAHRVVLDAAASANSALFWATAIVAGLAVIAALAVPRLATSRPPTPSKAVAAEAVRG